MKNETTIKTQYSFRKYISMAFEGLFDSPILGAVILFVYASIVYVLNGTDFIVVYLVIYLLPILSMFLYVIIYSYFAYKNTDGVINTSLVISDKFINATYGGDGSKTQSTIRTTRARVRKVIIDNNRIILRHRISSWSFAFPPKEIRKFVEALESYGWPVVKLQ